MAKSKGFKSGEEGGHNSFGQNSAIFLLPHSWPRLAMWDVPLFYWWRVIPPSSNAAFIHQPFPQQLQIHALTYPNPSPIKKKGRSSQPKPLRPRPRQKPAAVLETQQCRLTGPPVHSLYKPGHPGDRARPRQ